MQQAKTSSGRYVFTINEWLTTGQIRSYFSRLRSTTVNKIDRMSTMVVSAPTNYAHDDNEENVADEDDAQVLTLFYFYSIYEIFSF